MVVGLAGKGVRVMAFNTTFNNISAISWCSVFLLEETAVTGENQRPAASHSQTLSQHAASNILFEMSKI
jgi:hypothetical protein